MEATSWKNKGNEAFRSKDFKEALGYYHKSLDLIQDPKVLSNQAAVYLKLEAFSSCINDCTKAIELDPDFLKPYNRRAQAYTSMKKY